MSDHHLREVAPPLMTVAEVAEYLRVSEPSVYRLRTQHGLPSIQYGKRHRRFRRSDVDRWLTEQQERAA